MSSDSTHVTRFTNWKPGSFGLNHANASPLSTTVMNAPRIASQRMASHFLSGMKHSPAANTSGVRIVPFNMFRKSMCYLTRQ